MTENTAAGVQPPLFFPESVPTALPEPVAAAQGDPRRGPGAIRLDAAAIRRMGEQDLQQQILWMLACLRRRPVEEVAAGAAHADGTLGITSVVAVWIISTVGKAFGRRLVRLSEVDRKSLRSVGGVASLIRTSISPLPLARAA